MSKNRIPHDATDFLSQDQHVFAGGQMLVPRFLFGGAGGALIVMEWGAMKVSMCG
jgi:hypothetical protein